MITLLALLISCTDPSVNLRQVPFGFKCVTYRGGIFERVDGGKLGEAWRGQDGVVWGDDIGAYDFAGAHKACSDIGAILPPLEIYEHGYQAGMDGVMPNMFDPGGYHGRHFWTSTSLPGAHAGDPITPICMDDGLYAYTELDAVYATRCVRYDSGR